MAEYQFLFDPEQTSYDLEVVDSDKPYADSPLLKWQAMLHQLILRFVLKDILSHATNTQLDSRQLSNRALL
jgi:hypothetical protein